MKTILFACLAALAAGAYAAEEKDIKPLFKLQTQEEFDNRGDEGAVSVPYDTGVGEHSDCIVLEEPTTIMVHTFTEENEIFTHNHCVYLYKVDAACAGKPDNMYSAPAKFSDSWSIEYESIVAAVVRKETCPEEVPASLGPA